MKKVLFVCVHNTARSVIAESIFNSRARKWRAESAGIEKAEKIDDVVAEMLVKKGLKVKSRPRTIEEINLDEFDLIVIVCEGDRCPNVQDSKAVESWNIDDPAGGDGEIYRMVYADIEKRVEELLERLEGRL